jgi:hypothetical protein
MQTPVLILVPKEKVPKEKVPKEKVPKEKVPKEKVPKEKVPKEKVPKEKVPKEKVPKEKVPKEKVTKEKVPKKEKKIDITLETKNTSSEEISISMPVTVAPVKKRGRKPKGGKIISLNDANDTTTTTSFENQNNKHKLEMSLVSTNVILHLKCSYTDMHSNSISMFKYEPNIETVESYADSNDISETACEYKNSTNTNNDGITESIDEKYKKVVEEHKMDSVSEILNNLKTLNAPLPPHPHPSTSKKLLKNTLPTTTITIDTTDDVADTISGNSSSSSISQLNVNTNASAEPMKEIFKKVNKLKLILHNDNAMFNAVQQSACFWDTCEFNTPVIHIPKIYNKVSDSYTVYGCFCSPECALAYLVRESLDSSVKFERIQMLNEMYNNVCNNTNRPVKPAPDPRYTLNKYYGNLSIEEYRKLLKSDHLLYIVNKPLTHSLPELYDDNNDFLINGRSASSSSSSSGPIPSSAAISCIGSTSIFSTKNKNKYMFPNQTQK